MRDWYTENCKILLKEIKHLNKGKDILCSWVLRLHIVKMVIYLNALYMLHIILIKIPVAFWGETWQNHLQIYMELQVSMNSQNNIQKGKKIGRLMFSDYKPNYTATVI